MKKEYVLVDKEWLLEIAKQIQQTRRYGTDKDEPEGTRYIQVSDTLATNFSNALIELAENGESSFFNALR
jgi:hypothetical protein